MNRDESWKLFLETGLPEAYTYMKAKQRQKKNDRAPDNKLCRD